VRFSNETVWQMEVRRTGQPVCDLLNRQGNRQGCKLYWMMKIHTGSSVASARTMQAPCSITDYLFCKWPTQSEAHYQGATMTIRARNKHHPGTMAG
jgi:hypothetical protein